MKTCCIVLILCFLCIGFCAQADDDNSDSDSDSDWNFYFEDDYPGISLDGADRAYTEGIRLSQVWAQDSLPQWTLPLVDWLTDSDSLYNVGIAAGQQIYTPTDLSQTAQIPTDQPYAGYLFVGGELHIRNEDVLHSFEFDLGIVGPPALGEQIQVNFHKIFGFEPVYGWSNQLHTEPILQIFYQQKRKWFEVQIDENPIFDLTTQWEGALGNLYVYAGIGAQLRFGYQLSDNFGPVVLTPLGVDPFVEPNPERGLFEAYVFASAEGRLMLRNLFLDGNTFVPSAHIARNFFVYDCDFGIALRLGPFKALWRQIFRSQEFTPEYSGPHAFASIDLTLTQRF